MVLSHREPLLATLRCDVRMFCFRAGVTGPPRCSHVPSRESRVAQNFT